MFDISHQHPYLNGAWHLAYYIPSLRNIEGTLSNHIIKFKDKEQQQLKGWALWSKDKLPQVGINFDYVVRALGSNELKVTKGTKSMDVIGGFLERSFSWKYVPETLEKNRITKPLHFLKTKPEREVEIHESYFVAKKDNNFAHKHILIIDDVTTTQTTIKEIIRALKTEWPSAKYYLFCLGRTDYNENGNDHIKNSYFNS
ncbi:hypothetical protein HF329_00630 [Chitinophaga oryzae]|uniref:Phosphoribosyltransferase domain-containing protein n=1 Tax=Chitinophaga oryzae TaxID=2725414 RepID=A0AAE6ZBZ5_9BACT|nr:hypothetical protein [Chitinophaga oryzae]QJB29889.1 hypothetical protein HF329_00630 [Chitinophaga oryzae]